MSTVRDSISDGWTPDEVGPCETKKSTSHIFSEVHIYSPNRFYVNHDSEPRLGGIDVQAPHPSPLSHPHSHAQLRKTSPPPQFIEQH